MQPTLAITAPAPGIIHINGRFAGETDENNPLLLPVQSFGPIYLGYAPLKSGYSALTRKLVLSNGSPLSDNLPEELFCICWPGGIIEIELSAPEQPTESTEDFSLDGLPGQIHRGPSPHLTLGTLHCSIPKNAQVPEIYHLNGCIALLGSAGTDRYLLTLTADVSHQTGYLRAQRMDFESPEILRAVLTRDDIAGHGTLERWQLGEFGLHLLSSEPIWTEGAPRRPQTPEQAALAAVEAALLSRFDEAYSYFSPSLRERFSLEHIKEICDLCTPMKFGIPEGKPCIGLLHLESGNLATVRPLFYRADRFGSEWLLTELSME